MERLLINHHIAQTPAASRTKTREQREGGVMEGWAEMRDLRQGFRRRLMSDDLVREAAERGLTEQ
ncbi:hypothetical protein E2C01_072413 [Portunus trituberculatus]|uniref:Uncharacterized protein n=1 Tax=Portunus trituberculatus TaxID=210409 RepID=A0A5B7IB50_PORTR|nr:hypothetical protein [Portunus trituberculatus]